MDWTVILVGEICLPSIRGAERLGLSDLLQATDCDRHEGSSRISNLAFVDLLLHLLLSTYRSPSPVAKRQIGTSSYAEPVNSTPLFPYPAFALHY